MPTHPCRRAPRWSVPGRSKPGGRRPSAKTGSAQARRKRERVAVERCPLHAPSGPNHNWSMDFVFDALANGRPIKCLTVVDDCTKEAVEIAVARRINGQGVADILETVCHFRGYPAMIRTDQGRSSPDELSTSGPSPTA